jgi:hypothetical protein
MEVSGSQGYGYPVFVSEGSETIHHAAPQAYMGTFKQMVRTHHDGRK